MLPSELTGRVSALATSSRRTAILRQQVTSYFFRFHRRLAAFRISQDPFLALGEARSSSVAEDGFSLRACAWQPSQLTSAALWLSLIACASRETNVSTLEEAIGTGWGRTEGSPVGIWLPCLHFTCFSARSKHRNKWPGSGVLTNLCTADKDA